MARGANMLIGANLPLWVNVFGRILQESLFKISLKIYFDLKICYFILLCKYMFKKLHQIMSRFLNLTRNRNPYGTYNNVFKTSFTVLNECF
jgi:hypothetical protein